MLNGLFELEAFKTDSLYCMYWLATPPSESYRTSVYAVLYNEDKVYGDVDGVHHANNSSNGVRPVVVLSSGVEIVDTDGNGVYEIK